jgi:hypothetical protein
MFIGQMKYTRILFKVSKPFRWYGPVHEFIVCDENISHLDCRKLVNVQMDSASCKVKHQKYLDHAID